MESPPGLSQAGVFATDGACLEPWKLKNFQPQSDTFNTLVHSASYRERVTIVLLLSSG